MENNVKNKEKIKNLKQNNNEQTIKKGISKKVKNISIISVALIIVLGIVGFIVTNSIKEKERKQEAERIKIEKQETEYKEKIAYACKEMNENIGTGSTYTSTYLNLLSKYGNTLGESYVKGTLRGTNGSEKIVESMKETNRNVEDTMNWLSANRMEKYSDLYNVLLEMYDAYKPFYESTVDLNFKLYSAQDVISKGKIVLEKYDRIIIMMPEIKELTAKVDSLENKEESL